MRKFLSVLVCLVFVSALIGVAFASTPNKIKYQGSLKKAGVPLNGATTMIFRITNANGSHEYWTSGSTSVPVSQGIFNYTLEISSVVDWQAGGYYLEITVEGTTLLPRDEIDSTPYALNAKSIDDGAITKEKTNIVSINPATGKIPALTANYFDNLDGSQLLNVGGGSVVDSSVRLSTGVIQGQLNNIATSTGTLDTNKLNLSGGTLTGNLDASGHIVLASTIGVTGATKLYGDGSALTGLAGGGNMNTGVYDLNTNGVVDNSEALNGHPDTYFATAASTGALDTNKLNLSGGTMTGTLVTSTITVSGNITLKDGTVLTSTSTLGGGGYDVSQVIQINGGGTVPNTPSGVQSVAMGQATTSSGDESFAMGDTAEADGYASVAMGEDAHAGGDASLATGRSTYAGGDYSTALGNFTAADGEFSTTMGLGSVAHGSKAIAMGDNTTADGEASTAMGSGTTASADYTTAIGVDVENAIPNSLIVGFGNPGLTVMTSSTIINGITQIDTMTVTGLIVLKDGTILTSTSTLGGGGGGGWVGTAASDLDMAGYNITDTSVGSVTLAADLDMNGNNLKDSGSDVHMGSNLDMNNSQLVDYNYGSVTLGSALNMNGEYLEDDNTGNVAMGVPLDMNANLLTDNNNGYVSMGVPLDMNGQQFEDNSGTVQMGSNLDMNANVLTDNNNSYVSMGVPLDMNANLLTDNNNGYVSMGVPLDMNGQQFEDNSGTVQMGSNLDMNANVLTDNNNSYVSMGVPLDMNANLLTDNNNGYVSMGVPLDMNGQQFEDNSGSGSVGMGSALNMGNNQILNVSSITVNGEITFKDGTVLSSTATLGGGGSGGTDVSQVIKIHGGGTPPNSATGTQSVAMGAGTTANGNWSTAMGNSTTASGLYSTAMGYQTATSGAYSTAMGFGSNIGADYATAIGSAVVTAQWSVGIGEDVKSTAVNNFVIGKGNASHNFLINSTPNSLLVGFGTSALAVSTTSIIAGSTTTVQGNLTVNGQITLPDGTIITSTSTLGGSSVSQVIKINGGGKAPNTPSGVQSVAMGAFTTANGSTSTAMGEQTTASGQDSTAMGYATTASGIQSTAMGAASTAGGYASVAMGGNAIAAVGSYYTIAMGDGTTAGPGQAATAMGQGTTASGQQSTAMGYATTASGAYSTAMGLYSNASGAATTAMGNSPTAYGSYSTAIGIVAVSSGNAAITIGDEVEASADHSLAIGRNLTSSAANAFVLGAGPVYTNRLINNTPNSLMVGFNRTTPTFTVFQSSVEINGAAGPTGDILLLSTGTDANNNVARIDNTGKGWFNNGTATGGADYAEWFKKEQGELKSGDIIGLNLKTQLARKYQSGDALLGICSTNPSVIGNQNINKTDETMKQDYVLVGLVGQLAFNSEQVNIVDGKVLTKDSKQIGYLLDGGKVVLRIKD